MTNDITIQTNITATNFFSAQINGMFNRFKTSNPYPENIGTFIINDGCTVTGTRYNITLNSVASTSGGGANFFPGDTAGITSTGGQFL